MPPPNPAESQELSRMIGFHQSGESSWWIIIIYCFVTSCDLHFPGSLHTYIAEVHTGQVQTRRRLQLLFLSVNRQNSVQLLGDRPTLTSFVFYARVSDSECTSRVHERYRRQTDGRTMTYSEREREFTFAKNEANKKLFCYSPIIV